METWHSLWPQKVTGSLEDTMTYFMNLKVTVTICSQFDLVYDSKRSRGHKRSTWPTLWPKRSRWPLWSVWPSLWPRKVMGSLEVAVTYFMTQGHGDLCCRRDLLYDPRSRWPLLSVWPTLWPQMSRWTFWSVWPSLWPQKVKGSLEVNMTYFMTQKVNLTSDLDLERSSIWPGRWPQMSRQHYNAIRQPQRSIP